MINVEEEHGQSASSGNGIKMKHRMVQFLSDDTSYLLNDMAFLFTSALRAGTTRLTAGTLSRYSPLRSLHTTSLIQAEAGTSSSSYSSGQPLSSVTETSPADNASSTSPRSSANQSRRQPDLASTVGSIDLGDLMPPERSSPTEWWRTASNNVVGIPNTPFSGRSLPVGSRASDFTVVYRRLQRSIRQSGLKNDIRRAEYYEKPTTKRVRLASERHRRRFAAKVSSLNH
jgi:ribosomal protein S21